MKLVETILYGQWLKYKKKLKELEAVEGSDFVDSQLRAAIHAGIILEPTELDELPVGEVTKVYKAFSELYVKSLNPETKN